MADQLAQLNNEMAEIIERVRYSLVRITNSEHSAGAGTIWHSDGLIITNAHVIQYPQVEVTLWDGRAFPGYLLARDPKHDLAAVSIDAHDLPAIELGKSKQLRPGEWVMALGHPWGVLGGVTAGVVIGVNAHWPEFSPNGQEWVISSLHLRPGHSGGPLVNAQGQLVGINTMMNGPDVGIAIPVDIAKAFLREAMKKEAAAVS